MSDERADNGRSLKQKVSALLRRFGAEAVRKEIAAQTKKKRGPKPKPDWLAMLHPVIDEDAVDLLHGRDPFTLRTDYMLARKFAKSKPGQSLESTIERLEIKLRADRRRVAYFEAWMLAIKSEVPFAVELRIVAELDGLTGDEYPKVFQSSKAVVAHYRECVGEPPPEWSIRKILDELPRPDRLSGELGAALVSAMQAN